MKLLRNIGLGLLAVIFTFLTNGSLAQVAIDNRSHLWPEGRLDVYGGIIDATSGVLTFLIVIFALVFFLIWRKIKIKKINLVLIPYSALCLGFVAYLYYDTFASVDEFLRLCKAKAGFHGQAIPKGAGVIVNENLRFGCGFDCQTPLRVKGNVSFVEGTSKAVNYQQLGSSVLYQPGFYKVTLQGAETSFCKGPSDFQINDAPIVIYKLPEPHCFYFEQIEKLTADYSVRDVPFYEFRKAKNIFGFLKEIKNVKTGEILATDGHFYFKPGKIDKLNFSRIGMDGVTIANCWDKSASFERMWGRED